MAVQTGNKPTTKEVHFSQALVTNSFYFSNPVLKELKGNSCLSCASVLFIVLLFLRSYTDIRTIGLVSSNGFGVIHGTVIQNLLWLVALLHDCNTQFVMACRLLHDCDTQFITACCCTARL